MSTPQTSSTPPIPEVTTSSNGRSRFASRSPMDLLAESLDGRLLMAIPKKGELLIPSYPCLSPLLGLGLFWLGEKREARLTSQPVPSLLREHATLSYRRARGFSFKPNNALIEPLAPSFRSCFLAFLLAPMSGSGLACFLAAKLTTHACTFRTSSRKVPRASQRFVPFSSHRPLNEPGWPFSSRIQSPSTCS
jgi:hypothetical protein